MKNHHVNTVVHFIEKVVTRVDALWKDTGYVYKLEESKVGDMILSKLRKPIRESSFPPTG